MVTRRFFAVFALSLILLLPTTARSWTDISVLQGSLLTIMISLALMKEEKPTLSLLDESGATFAKNESDSDLSIKDESLRLVRSSQLKRCLEFTDRMIFVGMLTGKKRGSDDSDDESMPPKKEVVFCCQCKRNAVLPGKERCSACVLKGKPSGGACVPSCSKCKGDHSVKLIGEHWLCEDCARTRADITVTGDTLVKGCVICSDEDDEESIPSACKHFHIHVSCLAEQKSGNGGKPVKITCAECGSETNFSGPEEAEAAAICVENEFTVMNIGQQIAQAQTFALLISEDLEAEVSADMVLAAFSQIPGLTHANAMDELASYLMTHDQDIGYTPPPTP